MSRRVRTHGIGVFIVAAGIGLAITALVWQRIAVHELADTTRCRSIDGLIVTGIDVSLRGDGDYCRYRHADSDEIAYPDVDMAGPADTTGLERMVAVGGPVSMILVVAFAAVVRHVWVARARQDDSPLVGASEAWPWSHDW